MNSIEPLVEYVKIAGDRAAEGQLEVKRGFKNDGSIITHIDKELDRFLSKIIREKYPEANLITEETVDTYDSNLEYSFAVDPIDGTDCFSQFMPGWCVSVGLLRRGEPVAGIVYAPLWGLKGGTLIFCDIEGNLMVNGTETAPGDIIFYGGRDGFQVAAGSGIHKYFNFSSFRGKVRTAGAAVINIVAPLIHSAVGGTLITPCNIWDIAAAHAIVKRAGLEFRYYSGGAVDYSTLYSRDICSDFIVSGHKSACDEIVANFIKTGQYHI